MKFTDWIKQIILPLVGKAEDADLFLAASDLKGVDVPEDMQKAFNKKYLTRESAYSDEELSKKFAQDALGKAYGSVDQKIKKLLPLLSEEDQGRINAETNTLLKLDLIEKALPGLSKSEDVKKVSEKARKAEEEYHKRVEELEKSLKAKDEELVKKTGEIKLDYALRSKLFGIELAPEFSSDKHKNFLADSTIANLKKGFVLEFDENDQSIIHLRKNVEGQIKDHYEGNVKVTLDDVLKKEYEPYLKKSNGKEHSQKDEQKKKVEIPNDRPLTLAEQRIAEWQRTNAPAA